MATNGPLPIRYIIEIHSPERQGVYQQEASSPFGAISEGDLVNPRAFSNVPDVEQGVVWRVARIEHMVYDHSDTYVMHQISIHTDAVPDDHIARQDPRWAEG